ncbi:VanZ family protein [Adhaeribacter aquaticus]|uniref:VanZ family protein n=1 Tax=Adhaeribacter aquaticus TaxID=299567 RepID=UPI000685CEE5|nr:VanZ family protein [Adhaeribacter aquaticus]
MLFLTLLPTDKLPTTPEWQLISFYTASHAAVFFLLAILMLRGFTKQKDFAFLNQHSVWLTFVVSVLFGAMIELLQSTMGLGRQGDIMDVISNSLGTIAGISLFFPIRRFRLLGSWL